MKKKWILEIQKWILMVESNLQRSIILPSEKAFSYKMRLEAMKRQGQRTDLTSTPVVSKSRTLSAEKPDFVQVSETAATGHCLRLRHFLFPTPPNSLSIIYIFCPVLWYDNSKGRCWL